MNLSLKQRFDNVLSGIDQAAQASGRNPDSIKLIVVTKFQPVESLREAESLGYHRFGESRVQELLLKVPQLPAGCEWHFIGPLQVNKVSKVLPHVSLIHSVDNLKVAQKISSVAQQPTAVLLQVNVSGEASKQGLSPVDWEARLDEVNLLPHLEICGLMTMAPFVQDEKVLRTCFRTLYELLHKWKPRMRNPSLFKELSMGMSNDYPLAVQEGATMVRIGSALFK